jgi:cytochrome d ubiquinol oxidase subunit II
MSSATLASIAFIIISFSWIVYIVQEMFITGSSALNMAVSENEAERKQIQVISGIHFDGIEVWLLVSIVLTLGIFPLVFAETFTYLYVIFFLLLYAIIARGVSIEVIYKMDSKKWIKAMVVTWTVSSGLLIFILGVYLSNIFYGFPLDSSGEMASNYLSLFNITGIFGGLFFLSSALVAGAGWIKINTTGNVGDKAVKVVKKYGIIYIMFFSLMITVMGFNNTDASIYIGELFSKSIIFFILPIMTLVFALITLYSGFKERGKRLFIFGLLTMTFFLITGFVGIYPYMVPSNISLSNGITIYDAVVSNKAINVVLIVVIIFYPIIFLYQGWKYKNFTKKVNLNDE